METRLHRFMTMVKTTNMNMNESTLIDMCFWLDLELGVGTNAYAASISTDLDGDFQSFTDLVQHMKWYRLVDWQVHNMVYEIAGLIGGNNE